MASLMLARIFLLGPEKNCLIEPLSGALNALHAWQVARVLYPGLPEHPYFPRVQKLFGGLAGGVVTFELLGGAAAAEMMFQVHCPFTSYAQNMCMSVACSSAPLCLLPQQDEL